MNHLSTKLPFLLARHLTMYRGMSKKRGIWCVCLWGDYNLAMEMNMVRDNLTQKCQGKRMPWEVRLGLQIDLKMFRIKKKMTLVHSNLGVQTVSECAISMGTAPPFPTGNRGHSECPLPHPFQSMHYLRWSWCV